MKFILPIAVFTCIAWAASVSTDYDHRADFGRFHTYYWIGVKAGDSLWQDRIMSAVDGQLAGKGWTRSQGSGDAAVSAFGRVNERDNLETFYDGFPGWGWRHWGGGMGMATTEVIAERVGNLTVDISTAIRSSWFGADRLLKFFRASRRRTTRSSIML